MTSLIGYYVHHHGEGHLQRARAVLRHISGDAAVLTQADVPAGAFGPDVEIVSLPPDAPAHGHDPTARGALHWAPLDVAVSAPRTAMIAAWVEARRPDLLVVDVSIEVTLLARLLGVPTAVVRLHGTRADRAHQLAFDCASTIVAPFPTALEDPSTDPDLAHRTFHAGIISLHGDPPTVPPRPHASAPRIATIIWGRGGEPPTMHQLCAAARACPDWTWRYIGPGHHRSRPAANLEVCGWVTDVPYQLATADVVIGAAGNGTISAVTQARRPFICLPQPRPFDEQLTTGRQLSRLGVAEVSEDWPQATAWQLLLERARMRSPETMANALPVDDGRLFARHLDCVAATARH
jgi:hypothetical protein